MTAYPRCERQILGEDVDYQLCLKCSSTKDAVLYQTGQRSPLPAHALPSYAFFCRGAPWYFGLFRKRSSLNNSQCSCRHWRHLKQTARRPCECSVCNSKSTTSQDTRETQRSCGVLKYWRPLSVSPRNSQASRRARSGRRFSWRPDNPSLARRLLSVAGTMEDTGRGMKVWGDFQEQSLSEPLHINHIGAQS